MTDHSRVSILFPAKIADYFLPKGKSAHNAASGDAAGRNASKPTLVRKTPKAQSVGCPVHGVRQMCSALLNVSRIGSWGQGEQWPWDGRKKIRNRSAHQPTFTGIGMPYTSVSA